MAVCTAASIGSGVSSNRTHTHAHTHTHTRPTTSAARRIPLAFRRVASRPSLCSGRRIRGSPRRAAEEDFDLDALLDGLEPPALEGEPRYYQEAAGGMFEGGIAVSFGKTDKDVPEAMRESVVLVDRSHWGRLRIGGDDRVSFLHNQSTANIAGLAEGQGTDTVLVTAQARTLDVATALVQESGIMLIVSPGQAAALVERFQKYIFPMDKVEVMDISERCGMLTLVGPGSDELLAELGAGDVVGKPEGSHTLLNFGGSPVIAAVTTGLRMPGYTLIVGEDKTGELWRQLAMKGAVPMGADAWEQARILQGCPAPGKELTEDYNPLEAGLCHAVSLAKGCYIGQETIAKVHNLGAGKQQLWGLDAAAACECGEEVLSAGGAKLGAVTSATAKPEGGFFALAYLKCKVKGGSVGLAEGLPVTVGGRPAKLAPLPYSSRALLPKDLPPSKDAAKEESATAGKDDAAAAAKEAKLKAMQERLAAYQAQMAAGKKEAK